MGPFLVNPDGHSLRRNPYAWNKYASIVYIEAPAGVGYSYTTDGNFTTDDEQMALDNYEGLKQFFTLHPSFRHHSVFITGESYAGIYVPTLTALVVEGQEKFPINLKASRGN
jgi:cathepsin A (carboxypeptidase C)